MSVNDFIGKVENEFEELKPGTLYPDSIIKEHVSWDSVNALIFIALINVEYSVEINAEDLVNSKTIQELYNIVEARTTS